MPVKAILIAESANGCESFSPVESAAVPSPCAADPIAIPLGIASSPPLFLSLNGQKFEDIKLCPTFAPIKPVTTTIITAIDTSAFRDDATDIANGVVIQRDSGAN